MSNGLEEAWADAEAAASERGWHIESVMRLSYRRQLVGMEYIGRDPGERAFEWWSATAHDVWSVEERTGFGNGVIAALRDLAERLRQIR